MADTGRTYRCVILAGERPGGSLLPRQFGVSTSVMVPVAGKPLLQSVMEAVDASQQTDGGIICGPGRDIIESDPALGSLLQTPSHRWLEPAAGPAASAVSALQALGHFPALLTTGDHALLTPEIVDNFCQLAASRQDDEDLVIGFVPYELVNNAWPESKRTVLRFSDGGYCGANLFAILHPEGLKALSFWRQVESQRKKPWKIARRFGIASLLRYLFRRLSLEETLAELSKAAGCRIGHVKLEFARAAVDVDSIADQQLAERILSSQE